MALSDFNLITDRTQADVDYAKSLNSLHLDGMTAEQLTEFLGGLKGSYNATDLNRVTAAMEYLVERIRHYGYTVEYTPLVIPHRSDGKDPYIWYVDDIATPDLLAVYLENIRNLREVYPLITPPEVPPDMEEFTYEEANNIERILVILETHINRMVASFFYSGQPYSGQIWSDFV